MSELTCGGRTNPFRSATEFVGNFSQRGIVIVISDFFDQSGCERAVEVLRSARHDFVLIQVHSAEDQKPSVEGELLLEDAETGAQRVVTCSAESAALYERKFLEFCENLQRLAQRNGGRYAQAATNITYQDFVLAILRSEQVLA
jgi:hypothetical protein